MQQQHPLKPRQRRSRRSPSSPAGAACRRVGGGYELGPTVDAAAALAAADAGALLSGLDGPLSEADLRIMRDILRCAEAGAVQDATAQRAPSARISLARLLDAYAQVLPRHGLAAAPDTHYYRLLLKLALDPGQGWWDRFADECRQGARRHGGGKRHGHHAGSGSGHGGGGGSAGKHSARLAPVTSPAKRRSGSGGKPLPPRGAPSSAPVAAVRAASAAVDAISAAIAAVLQSAGMGGGAHAANGQPQQPQAPAACAGCTCTAASAAAAAAEAAEAAAAEHWQPDIDLTAAQQAPPQAEATAVSWLSGAAHASRAAGAHSTISCGWVSADEGGAHVHSHSCHKRTQRPHHQQQQQPVWLDVRPGLMPRRALSADSLLGTGGPGSAAAAAAASADTTAAATATAAAAAAEAGLQALAQSVARVRSRSASPLPHRRSSSASSLGGLRMRGSHAMAGAVVHEFPPGGSSAAEPPQHGAACHAACTSASQAVAGGSFQPPTAPARAAAAGVEGWQDAPPLAEEEALPAALLLAGQQQQLWQALDLEVAASKAGALQRQLDSMQQLEQQQQQQRLGGAGSPQRQHQQQRQHEALLRLQLRTVAAGTVGDDDDDDAQAAEAAEPRTRRYAACMQFAAVQHNWRARALAAHTTRDVLAAAEQMWRLSMSFWEVHAAWRALQAWRAHAAAAAQASAVHRRAWLLMRSFQWWRGMVLHYRRQQEDAAEYVEAQQVRRQLLQQQQQQQLLAEAPGSSGAHCRSASPPRGRTGALASSPGGQQLAAVAPVRIAGLAGHLMQEQQAALSRPTSPLTGIARLLQRHPELRPPHTAAGEMRQQPSGRVAAAHVFAAWLLAVQERAAERRLQERLAWHHVQHVQAGVWNRWRVAYEERCPHHKLMTVVYKARRHATLGKALHRWRLWAPLKHARRRQLRDARIALHASTRARVWQQLRSYTALRRAKGAATRRAQAHFWSVALVKFLAAWLHSLDIRAAWDELADSHLANLLDNRARAMLRCWHRWVLERQRREEQLQAACAHMQCHAARRCMAAWQARVQRRQLLQELLERGLQLSARALLRAAVSGWSKRNELQKWRGAATATLAVSCRRRRLTACWLAWLDYLGRRQQQRQLQDALTQRNTRFVWRTMLTRWHAQLQWRVRLVSGVASLQRGLAQRCLLHWQARAAHKADWRSFQADAVQRMTHVRMALVLRLWHAAAFRRGLMLGLLAGLLQRSQQRQQRRAFDAWRGFLLVRVAKRMNALSALLQWEQGLTRRALQTWVQRTGGWRRKRQQRLRADSYRALRLLDLALTGWSSVWAEGREAAQKAAFFLAGKQMERKLAVLRAWGPEAARLRLKRQRLEIARLHSVITRQHQVIAVWHVEVAWRLRLRAVLGAAVQRWSQLAVSRAFEQWRCWALEKAGLHRRMRAVVSLLAGRSLQWSFCMLREHALRKRRSRAARHHHQRQLAACALQAWHQLACDAASFRGVVAGVGAQLRSGLLADALVGWRDVVRAKQWKEAAMMRALLAWGGSRRHVCFQTWRQWVALKRGKQAGLLQAGRHWRSRLAGAALAAWLAHTQRKQVARHVLATFRGRYLAAALSEWRRWTQRRAYLAAVFAQLQGKGHEQLTRVVWAAWRSFVPHSQVKRRTAGSAQAHWRRRALILCFAGWQEHATLRAWQRQQLADALLRWDSRRMWLALEGWRAVLAHRRSTQQQLSHGRARHLRGVLAACFRTWREEAQLQAYRRHVIVVVSGRVNNGLLLKAFNCWRDQRDYQLARRGQQLLAHTTWVQHALATAFAGWRARVEYKQARRGQHSVARNTWALRTQLWAFSAWLDVTQEEAITRQVVAHRQARVLARVLGRWHAHALQQRQYGLITRAVTSKRVSRLMLVAWTAWREVLDQRRQVEHRLLAVARGWDFDTVLSAFAGWHAHASLKQLSRRVTQRWRSRRAGHCLAGWRHVAARQRAAADKVAVAQAAGSRRLAVAVLREWAELAWLLPRQQRSGELAAAWLQRRALWGWRRWVLQRQRRQQVSTTLAARWTNLRMAAAWRAWRSWVDQRRAKAELAASATARWRNLQLAPALQAWRGMVAVLRRRQAAEHTIADRWRNLHTAAAFGAWRVFAQTRRQHTAVAAKVSARWGNLHLATAFSCWRQAAAEGAARVAAAEASGARVATTLLAVALLDWRDAACTKARLRQQASHLSGRQQQLSLTRSLSGWQEAVAWRATKHAADQHWRQVVLRSLLALWLSHTRKQAGFQETAHIIRGRTHMQLLRRSLAAWQQHVLAQQHKATADDYAAARLQQRAFLSWAQQSCLSRSKAGAAVDMAARVLARTHNQLACSCWEAWRAQAARGAAFKAAVLSLTLRRLRACLLAWRHQARVLSGATCMLRRLLVSTLRGAFSEWRIVAQERAHWRHVALRLQDQLEVDGFDGGAVAARARQAVARWVLWPAPAAFAAWRGHQADARAEAAGELKAAQFLRLALSFKSLAGFKQAVQAGRAAAAAGDHRRGAATRAALRGWRAVAVYLQEKRHKAVAADFHAAAATKRRALGVLQAYAAFRRLRAAQTLAARHHCRQRSKAVVLGAWRTAARYLAPIRQALHTISRKRRHASLRQLFGGWKLVCHRSQLLRHALARRARVTAAAAFAGWRTQTLDSQRRLALLQAAVTRISHLLLARAFCRWAEAAVQRRALRARAEAVLRAMLQRRMRGSLAAWRQHVQHRATKRAKLAAAAWHARGRDLKKAMQGWAAFVKEARQHAATAGQLLAQRQRRQRAAALRWWHLVAQDLHHHRVVLASFRARHVHQEGVAVFGEWREWARWRTLERRAIVVYWKKLLGEALAAWVAACEESKEARAAAHDARRRSVAALAAWRLGAALRARKRALSAAASDMAARRRAAHAMLAWLRFAYYRHMGHVALHFRIRRLGCVVMRHWHRAAHMVADERAAELLLTHELATARATRILTGWQHHLRARQHWRRATQAACLRFWMAWAPAHAARNAGWRAAALQLAAAKRARCFYCWRWYCQVRLLREVAFQNKQRAIREALAIGEQVARRRRAALLASAFMAWHVQVSKYRKVAQKLSGLLQRSLATCFRSWREAASAARVSLLVAQRHADGALLSKVVSGWSDAAAELHEVAAAREAAAIKLARRRLLAAACTGWAEEVAVCKEQRAGLWALMLSLLGRERQALLAAGLGGWRGWVAARVALRGTVSAFVNKRRLEALSEYLTLWHQYAAAMRGAPGCGGSDGSPGGRDSSCGSPSRRPALLQHMLGQLSAAAASAPAAAAALARGASPPLSPSSQVQGWLPVTSGPGSPLLGPRSAQQDRRMARRLAAMGGAAAEVDAGSDTGDLLLFAGLPPTAAAAAALERQARQQPLLALARGYRQRRHSWGDHRRQYDDAREAAAGGVPSPTWDLHSVAESMQQAHEHGLLPWQLASVRSPSCSPEPASAELPRPDALSLRDLHTYAQMYPYSLHGQQQQQYEAQQDALAQQRAAVRASQQQPIGRPASAGACMRGSYRPLLEQQLKLQQEMLRQPAEELLQPPRGHKPWHTGASRWAEPRAAAAAAAAHWSERRREIILPADTDSSGRSSPSAASPSTVSAAAGSCSVSGQWQQQQQHRAHQGPRFGAQVLPKALAPLLGTATRQQR